MRAVSLLAVQTLLPSPFTQKPVRISDFWRCLSNFLSCSCSPSTSIFQKSRFYHHFMQNTTCAVLHQYGKVSIPISQKLCQVSSLSQVSQLIIFINLQPQQSIYFSLDFKFRFFWKSFFNILPVDSSTMFKKMSNASLRLFSVSKIWKRFILRLLKSNSLNPEKSL